MTKPTVYLAGPISGLTYEEANNWRCHIRVDLAPDIICFDPMRGQEYLKDFGVLEGAYESDPMTTARAIMIRDHWDCMRADLIIANFVDVKRISIGTCMEIAFAFAYRKPLIAIMEIGNPHDHPMVKEAVSYWAHNIGDAAAIARSVLLP